MAGMQTNNKGYNLASVFGSAVNMPNMPENIDGKTVISPLYPKSEGSKRAEGKHVGAWFDKAKHTFNSPRNARVVCLGRQSAAVDYWGPVKEGRKDREGFMTSPYKQGKSAVILRGTETPNQNAGLRCIGSPYILGNIEELWVVVDAFYCPNAHPLYMNVCTQVSQLGGGQAVKDAQNMLATILQEELKPVLKGRKLTDAFPLLRSIVAVNLPPHLHSFYQLANRAPHKKALAEKFQGQRGSVGELLLQGGLQQLKPDAMQLFQQCGFFVCAIPTGDVKKFAIEDYKYDELVLRGIRDKIFNKYKQETVVKNAVSAAVKVADVVVPVYATVGGVAVGALCVYCSPATAGVSAAAAPAATAAYTMGMKKAYAAARAKLEKMGYTNIGELKKSGNKFEFSVVGEDGKTSTVNLIADESKQRDKTDTDADNTQEVVNDIVKVIAEQLGKKIANEVSVAGQENEGSELENLLNGMLGSGLDMSDIKVILNGYESEHGKGSLEGEFNGFSANGKVKYEKLFNSL